jgi:hypothetical protein
LIPPARTIRTEFHNAIAHGIRMRGPEAVGLVLIGFAQIVIGVLVLVLLVAASEIVGIDVTAVPFTGMTGVSMLVSWLLTSSKEDGEAKDDQRHHQH